MVVVMTAAVLFASSSLAYAQSSVLVFGDSLSAGYGLARGEGWVALLRERLEASDADVKVVNASVSGETSAGGVFQDVGSSNSIFQDVEAQQDFPLFAGVKRISSTSGRRKIRLGGGRITD